MVGCGFGEALEEEGELRVTRSDVRRWGRHVTVHGISLAIPRDHASIASSPPHHPVDYLRMREFQGKKQNVLEWLNRHGSVANLRICLRCHHALLYRL